MGRKICPLCHHYDTCKFWETVFDLRNSLEVEWWNDDKFRKWQERFARFCMFFELDERQLASIHESLDFLFHDFIVQKEVEESE